MPKYLDDAGLRNIWTSIENLNSWMPANAPSHNSIYRGKNITSALEDGSIYSAISSGTFDDIFIGDYFFAIINDISASILNSELVVNISSDWATHLFRVMKLGKTEKGQNYALVMPDDSIGRSPIHSKNSLENGFAGSDMVTKVFPKLERVLKNKFKLISVNQYLISDLQNPDVDIVRSPVKLLNELEVFGSWINANNNYELQAGLDTSQLPGFRYNTDLCLDSKWWLRSIASNSSNSYRFSVVLKNGACETSLLTDINDLRPAFYIGLSDSYQLPEENPV